MIGPRQAKKYYHDFEGYNGRSIPPGGLAFVKLRHLEN